MTNRVDKNFLRDLVREGHQGYITRKNAQKTSVTGGSSDYYKLPPEAIDLQDLIEHKEMNFSIGNIFKACYRMGEKTTINTEYDLDKIIWFANREKKRLQRLKKQ